MAVPRQAGLLHSPGRDLQGGEQCGGGVADVVVGRLLRQHGLRAPATTAEQAAARLYALALHDGTQLCEAPWNVGALYLAPERRRPRFVPFRTARERLRRCYVAAGESLVAHTGGPPHAGGLAFRLVEALVNLSADGLATPDSPRQVAVGCVHIARWPGDVAAADATLLREVALHDGIPPDDTVPGRTASDLAAATVSPGPVTRYV